MRMENLSARNQEVDYKDSTSGIPGEAASKESVKVEEPQENGKSHEIGGTVIRERKSSRRNAHRYRVRRLDGRS
jgi:hypothetical protein